MKRKKRKEPVCPDCRGTGMLHNVVEGGWRDWEYCTRCLYKNEWIIQKCVRDDDMLSILQRIVDRGDTYKLSRDLRTRVEVLIDIGKIKEPQPA